MGTGTKLRLSRAQRLANTLLAELSPYARRSGVVGSIRRKRPRVGDIELLVEPRTVETGLFGELRPDILSIRDALRTWGVVLKGGSRFIQREMPDGTKIDVFLVHPPADWYVLLAIRTGPADLSREVVTRMQSRGYRCRGGRIVRGSGEEHPLGSEEEFFELAELPALDPTERDDWRSYL